MFSRVYEVRILPIVLIRRSFSYCTVTVDSNCVPKGKFS